MPLSQGFFCRLVVVSFALTVGSSAWAQNSMTFSVGGASAGVTVDGKEDTDLAFQGTRAKLAYDFRKNNSKWGVGGFLTGDVLHNTHEDESGETEQERLNLYAIGGEGLFVPTSGFQLDLGAYYSFADIRRFSSDRDTLRHQIYVSGFGLRTGAAFISRAGAISWVLRGDLDVSFHEGGADLDEEDAAMRSFTVRNGSVSLGMRYHI